MNLCRFSTCSTLNVANTVYKEVLRMRHKVLIRDFSVCSSGDIDKIKYSRKLICKNQTANGEYLTSCKRHLARMFQNKSCVTIPRFHFHTSSVKLHGEYEWQDPKSEKEIVLVNIVDRDGKMSTVKGKIGDNLLYLSKRFEIEMEGACEASLACTTCHVYVDDKYLDLLPEATETEEDLLDQAPFLKENSRLGCQIILNKQLDGIKLALPAVTKNFYVDGHKPTPH